MNKSRLVRIMVLALAIVTVFAITTTAFASWDEYISSAVYGGSSNFVWADSRSEPNSMDVDPTSITWNGQSGWKFRGYLYDYPYGYGTELKQIWDTKYYCADYIAGSIGTWYEMYMSIANEDDTKYLSYKAYLYF